MANLAAVDVTKMMQWASVEVYTVGAPRTGNHAYAKLYNQLVPDTWGIINYRVGHAGHLEYSILSLSVARSYT